MRISYADWLTPRSDADAAATCQEKAGCASATDSGAVWPAQRKAEGGSSRDAGTCAGWAHIAAADQNNRKADSSEAGIRSDLDRRIAAEGVNLKFFIGWSGVL
jgi:hypothetical protein